METHKIPDLSWLCEWIHSNAFMIWPVWRKLLKLSINVWWKYVNCWNKSQLLNDKFKILSIQYSLCCLDSLSGSTLRAPGIWVAECQLFYETTQCHISCTTWSIFEDRLLPILFIAATAEFCQVGAEFESLWVYEYLL